MRGEAQNVTTSKLARLLAACALVAAIWLGLLPWIADLPQERRQWRWLEQHKIDPSAMYYTELEAMQPILQRLNKQQRLGTKLSETPVP